MLLIPVERRELLYKKQWIDVDVKIEFEMNVFKNRGLTQTKAKPFVTPTIVQKKLKIGDANDTYEVEADRIADEVVGMSNSHVGSVKQTGSLLQRKCSACSQKDEIQKKSVADSITPLIQKKGVGTEGGVASKALTQQIHGSKGGGHNMDRGTQNFMESRFGADFSNIRIHTGQQAIQMSRDLNARAFTVGNDVYFNAGQYNPSSTSGKHLLAHELTHTIQQGGIQRKMIQRDFALEPPNPNVECEPLTEDEVNEAIRYNQRQRYQNRDIRLMRDVLGVSPDPVVFDADFVNAIACFQAQYNLDVDGKIGSTTGTHIGKEMQAEGRSLGRPDGAELLATSRRLCANGYKTVTIDFVKLHGATRSPRSDIEFANTVFRQCCVRFRIGQVVRATEAQTKSWLGGDTILQRISSCSAVHAEEDSMRRNATTTFGLTSRYKVFYMEQMLPDLRGVNFSPDCSSGARAPFNRHLYVDNSANRRTLAHELGHIPIVGLSDHTTHGGTARNLMIPNGPGSELTSRQCGEVQSNI